METNIIIIILNSLALFALGFVPSLAALELSCKRAHKLGKKRKKENATILSAATVGASKETTAYDHYDITIRGENGTYVYS